MPTLHVTYIQNLNNTHQTTSRQIRTSYLAQNFDTTIQTRTRNGTTCNYTATQEHTPTHTHQYSRLLLQHKHCHTKDIQGCSNAISRGPTSSTSQHNTTPPRSQGHRQMSTCCARKTEAHCSATTRNYATSHVLLAHQHRHAQEQHTHISQTDHSLRTLAIFPRHGRTIALFTLHATGKSLTTEGSAEGTAG